MPGIDTKRLQEGLARAVRARTEAGQGDEGAQLASGREGIGEALRSAGISPENQEAMLETLEQAGISADQVQDKASIINLIQGLTAGLDSSVKSSLADFIRQAAGELGAGPLPEDVEAFLSQWKKT
ncbi:MAG: hypothetical protein H5U02_10600 [Clostridia bacterium]|nr:hypothetical protein [Clostridia bacterium]